MCPRFLLIKRFRPGAGLLLGLALLLLAWPAGADLLIGTLGSDPQRAPKLHAAEITVATLGLAWDKFEPTPGIVNAAYVQEVKAKMAAFKTAGQEIVLDFGMQYPPQWVLDLPNGRYMNQYGVAFADFSPGKNIPNAVFNQTVRDREALYVVNVFKELGTGFKAVRLGWGWYGELHFPGPEIGDQSNCYWGFDDLAQGKSTGLPPGVPVCPVAGWRPGEASGPGKSAQQFVNWYFDALKDYQNWQVDVVRKQYKGWLTVLYPSWGIRAGQAETAIAANLSGETQVEKAGDMAQGVDFARLVRGITDKDVVPHCTWIDPEWGLDDRTNPGDWSPVHFLRVLADEHPLKLKVSGENTGGGGQAALNRTFERARREKLVMVLWAFEPRLFEGKDVGLEEFRVAALTVGK